MEGKLVTVGEKEYQVIKTGRAQAEQVVLISRWISKYGFRALKNISKDGTVEVESGVDFISQIIDNLTADALIELFVALIGCSKEDAEVYFDIAVLIDVLVEVYNNQPAVRKLIDRFFSGTQSQVASQG
jgi:hypothetical protein